MQPDALSDTDKPALRRAMLARRAALSPQEAARASAAVASRVWELPAAAGAREILAYLPVKNEIDASLVAREALARGIRLLLPRCRPGAQGILDIGCVTCLKDVVAGRFGILEPREDACRSADAFAPDLILVPAVAFDAAGNRLGFGGGYYDRLLARPMAAGAFTAGLAYAFQVLPRLPALAWDIPVDAVVTEHQTLFTHP
jgi:5-formyltetrahydrofolate cyclo-ligase